MTYLCGNHEPSISWCCKEDNTSINKLVSMVSTEYNWASLGYILLTQYDNMSEELMHTPLHNELCHVVKAHHWKWFLVGQAGIIIHVIHLYFFILLGIF